jgi:ribose transport system ATP-binding protein
LLRARGVSKTFAGSRVLHDVDIELGPGEVRALLGQNGSGKSTFIKILAGVHTPDPGSELLLRGRSVPLPVPRSQAADAGLTFMHQDLGLEPSLSVTDNFMLRSAAWRKALRPIGWRSQHRRVSAALAEFGLRIDVTAPVEKLSGPERAVTALVRALYELGGNASGILVLDEPTAGLEREAIGSLFDAVRAARARGCGVLFVSHNLEEAMTLCDTVSVLRDGRLVAEGPIADFTEAKLITAIIGRDLGQLYPPAPTARTAPIALSARGLSGAVVRGIDFDLHAGEILGVTGLAAMGQDELPLLLYGGHRPRGGSIHIGGHQHKPSPRHSLDSGMALVPADRKGLSGDMGATVQENLSLPVLDRYWAHGRFQRSRERTDVLDLLRSFDVRPSDPLRKLGELSGGNQQKALLGKWLALYQDVKILLLHEPTQGVDVGARQEIFRFIRDAAEKGAAILYVSTEHDDLAHLCDRVLILRNGRIAGELSQPLESDEIAARSLASTRESFTGSESHQ